MEVLNRVIILALIILAGIYCKKRGIVDEHSNKVLSNVLINLTMPCLIISSFNMEFSFNLAKNILSMMVYSLIIHVVLIIISKILFCKFSMPKSNVMKFIFIFSNSGFMGYPILEGIYGKIGVFYGSIFVTIFNVFILTYGLHLYEGKEKSISIKGILKNPGIVAVMFGMVMFFSSIKLPQNLMKAFEMVGSMTTPLSLLIIGIMMADLDFKTIFSSFKVYYVTFLRLIAAPIITFTLLKLINADNLLLNICVIIEAMPAAALSAVYAEKFNVEKEFTSKAIFVSTLFSIITIPLIAALLK